MPWKYLIRRIQTSTSNKTNCTSKKKISMVAQMIKGETESLIIGTQKKSKLRKINKLENEKGMKLLII